MTCSRSANAVRAWNSSSENRTVNFLRFMALYLDRSKIGGQIADRPMNLVKKTKCRTKTNNPRNQMGGKPMFPGSENRTDKLSAAGCGVDRRPGLKPCWLSAEPDPRELMRSFPA